MQPCVVCGNVAHAGINENDIGKLMQEMSKKPWAPKAWKPAPPPPSNPVTASARIPTREEFINSLRAVNGWEHYLDVEAFMRAPTPTAVAGAVDCDLAITSTAEVSVEVAVAVDPVTPAAPAPPAHVAVPAAASPVKTPIPSASAKVVTPIKQAAPVAAKAQTPNTRKRKSPPKQDVIPSTEENSDQPEDEKAPQPKV